MKHLFFLILLFIFFTVHGTADEIIETNRSFAVYCDSEGQLCSPKHSFSVETSSVLKVKYIVANSHCSSVRIHIFVDGIHCASSGFLGYTRYGGSSLPLETPLFDLGPVQPGTHLVEIEGEGTPGGCNIGALGSWGGTLNVVTSVSANKPPIASFTVSPEKPMVGGIIEFDASESIDPEGGQLQYEWDLGDGDVFPTSIPKWQKKYLIPKKYTVNLTVIDEHGERDSTSSEVDLTLLAGDILLCRTELSAVPAIEWTHCGIYDGNGKVIDAVLNRGEWKDIIEVDLENWFFPNMKYVSVVRVKDIEPEIRNAAVEFAKSQLNRPYDVLSIYNNEKQNGLEGKVLSVMWYCSELVWAAYFNASNGSVDIDYSGEGAISPGEIFIDDNTEIIGEHKELKPDVLYQYFDNDFVGIIYCPLDIEVTSPSGKRLNKEQNEIYGSVYQELDFDDDGSLNDFFVIPEPEEGIYLIRLIKESGDLAEGSFSFKIGDGYDFEILADNISINNIPEMPYKVLISKGDRNFSPIADAGPDQGITQLGQTVYLDGSRSWDPEGDQITFHWEINQKPELSTVTLNDFYSSQPRFVPDAYGEYIIQLTVSDSAMLSHSDKVTISFENIKPVADAGDNQSCMISDIVRLDGSKSFDPNGDSLIYSWIVVSSPAGSTTIINNSTDVNPTIIPDVPGEYVISLFVFDGYLTSEHSSVSIVAVSIQDKITSILNNAIEIINNLDDLSFKNKNMGKTLSNKLNEVILKIKGKEFRDALNKLSHDILEKINGCAEDGQPENNDWLVDCNSQYMVYPLIIDAIELLSGMI